MNILILLIVIGVLMALLPMDARFKQIIYVIVVVFVALWLVQVLGGGSFNTRLGL